MITISQAFNVTVGEPLRKADSRVAATMKAIACGARCYITLRVNFWQIGQMLA